MDQIPALPYNNNRYLRRCYFGAPRNAIDYMLNNPLNNWLIQEVQAWEREAQAWQVSYDKERAIVLSLRQQQRTMDQEYRRLLTINWDLQQIIENLQDQMEQHGITPNSPTNTEDI